MFGPVVNRPPRHPLIMLCRIVEDVKWKLAQREEQLQDTLGQLRSAEQRAAEKRSGQEDAGSIRSAAHK